MNKDLRNRVRVFYGPVREEEVRREPVTLLERALSFLGFSPYEVHTYRPMVEAVHPDSVAEHGDRLMIVDLGPDYDEVQALQFAALVLEDLALGSQDWRTKIE